MGYVATLLVLLLGATVAWAAPFASRLDTSVIQKKIDDYKLKTIDGVLEKLDPDMLQRNLLAYQSDESLQFASPLSPRVLVYNFDADFIMAFNGEPESEGYYELEIIRFDHKTAEFKPELISFDPKGIKKPQHDPAPTRCVKCHTPKFRPNWDPYFHWPGFYGSEDDNVNAGYDHKQNLLVSGPEFENYKKFLEKKDKQKEEKKGRYRFLPPHPNFRKNEHFNARVACLNLKRVVNEFARSPLASEIVKQLGAGAGSGEINVNGLPEEILKLAKRKYADVYQETKKVLAEARSQRIERSRLATGDEPKGRVRDLLEKTIASYNSTYDLPLVASWRFVFEELLKQKFRPYSTSRNFDYNLNLGAALDIKGLLEGHTKNKDGTLTLRTKSRDEYRDPQDTDYNYYCPVGPSDYYAAESPK